MNQVDIYEQIRPQIRPINFLCRIYLMKRESDSDSKSSKHEKKRKNKDKKERKQTEPVEPEEKPRSRSRTVVPIRAAHVSMPLLPTLELDKSESNLLANEPPSPPPPVVQSKIEQLPPGFAPKQDSVILQVQCVLAEQKNLPGFALLTSDACWFISKQVKGRILKLKWENVTEISKMRKKGTDKVVRISADRNHITFGSIKERDTFVFLAKLALKLSKATVQTYGFMKKGDEEVATRITAMKAPHVFEDSVSKDLNDILVMLRDGPLVTDMLAACGCIDIVPSQWTKTKNGIERMVSYVQPMSQNSDVTAVQTLMKSGHVCVFEMTEKFSRPSTGMFLESNIQFYFKEDEGVVNIRGAYGLGWYKETWDKEFVEAAVSRVNRMNFYYLKSKFSGESFNVAKYEGKWRMHQPYVLVISALVLLILCVLVLPSDTDWFRIIAGLCVLVFLFYM